MPKTRRTTQKEVKELPIQTEVKEIEVSQTGATGKGHGRGSCGRGSCERGSRRDGSREDGSREDKSREDEVVEMEKVVAEEVVAEVVVAEVEEDVVLNLANLLFQLQLSMKMKRMQYKFYLMIILT
ncbi:unnamed protein product [Rhizophagus irregularis]|nr:unnamed protein product [Rhizophagus irregularis]